MTLSSPFVVLTHLVADDDTMAAGGPDFAVLLLGVGGAAGRLIGERVSASLSAAVELDAVAGAGDAVAFAAAAAGDIRGAGRAGAVGAARGCKRWNIGVGIGVVVGFLLVEVGIAEACGECVDGGMVTALGDDVGSLHGVVWLRGLDLRGRNGAAAGNVLGHTAGLALGVAG